MSQIVFTEIKDYERGFGAYFQQYIAPLLDRLEQDRQRYLNWFIASAIIGGSIAGALLMPLWHSAPILNPFADVNKDRVDASFLIIIAAAVLPYLFYSRYGQEAKSVLLPPLMAFFGDLKYFAGRGFDASELNPFNILPPYDTFHSTDYSCGTLDGVKLELGKLALTRGSGKNRHSVFNGLVVRLSMNKSFQGMTLLRRHGMLVGLMDYGVIDYFGKAGMEVVQLEDPRFANNFDVRATDQVEARYLLTTTFMERLMLLGALMHYWGANPVTFNEQAVLDGAFSSRSNLMASFYNDALLLLIPCMAHLFEPGTLFSPATHTNEMRCVLYQIYLIRRIIEVLKLDQKTGM